MKGFPLKVGSRAEEIPLEWFEGINRKKNTKKNKFQIQIHP